jgi:hypothetical protein
MVTIRREPRFRLVLGLAIAAAGALALGGCNIGCMFAPCDLSGEIVATVRDPSGAPIGDALVEASSSEELTRSDGCADVHTLTSGPGKFAMGWHDVDLRATKDGYKPYEGSEDFGYYRVEITLEPTASSRASTATWKALSDDEECFDRPGPSTSSTPSATPRWVGPSKVPKAAPR